MHDDLEPLADGHSVAGVSMHRGFPNPAADSHGRGPALALDLNQLLVRHPSSTFIFRIHGETWAEQGIFDSDIAIIDRSLSARPYDLVLSWQNDQFTLCHKRSLHKYSSVWGVVSAIIHSYYQNQPGASQK